MSEEHEHVEGEIVNINLTPELALKFLGDHMQNLQKLLAGAVVAGGLPLITPQGPQHTLTIPKQAMNLRGGINVEETPDYIELRVVLTPDPRSNGG